ncbi:DMT family transporter [Paracoccus marinus]|uniref:DMT family transporter n=1 Tax=Paracoccus marinus TaxID=288426 RepID=UPI00103D4321|nr:DMT family transporter [Paracoccus marinus]GLS81546.1 peptide ABC transporter permease [Paracoccus marinus]
MDIKALAMGVTFAVIWASAFTSTRLIVTAAPPLTALVIRFGISAALAIGIALALGQRPRFSPREWWALVIFGLCQNALYLGLNWIGMQTVEASAASIIASMMPLLVALFGRLFLGDRLRPLAVLGLAAGLFGVALIMGVRLTKGLDPHGALLCVAAVVALAVATLAVRGAGGGRNVLMAVGVQMGVGAAALLLPALVMEHGRPIAWSGPLGAALLYTILAPGIGATFIWFQLVKRIGAVRAATFHFLSPPFGVAIAAALLGEHFGASDVIGSAIVAAGILMVQLSRVPAAPPYQAEDDIRAIHSASSVPARRTESRS